MTLIIALVSLALSITVLVRQHILRRQLIRITADINRSVADALKKETRDNKPGWRGALSH